MESLILDRSMEEGFTLAYERRLSRRVSLATIYLGCFVPGAGPVIGWFVAWLQTGDRSLLRDLQRCMEVHVAGIAAAAALQLCVLVVVGLVPADTAWGLAVRRLVLAADLLVTLQLYLLPFVATVPLYLGRRRPLRG